MKTKVADRIWNNNLNDGIESSVKNTEVAKISTMGNEKAKDRIMAFVNRVRANIGRDDRVNVVEAAVVGGKIVAVRCSIQQCSNQGAIVGGYRAYSIWNEEKFSGFWFNKVYNHWFTYDGMNFNN